MFVITCSCTEIIKLLLLMISYLSDYSLIKRKSRYIVYVYIYMCVCVCVRVLSNAVLIAEIIFMCVYVYVSIHLCFKILLLICFKFK